MSKPSILFVAHSPNHGGAEYSLLRLLEAIQPNITARVAAPAGGSFEQAVLKLGIEFYPTNSVYAFRFKKPSYYKEEAFICTVNSEAKRLSQTIPKCDLIHSNTFFIFTGALLAAHWQVPHVWNLREIPDRSPTWTSQLKFSTQIKMMNQLSDVFIAVSKALVEQTPGLDIGKSKVIHNGLDKPTFKPAKEARTFISQQHRLRPDDKIIATIGNLIPEKGHDFIIDVMAAMCKRHHDLMFWWPGEHLTTTDAVVKKIAHHNLQHKVIMPGPVKNASQYLKACDAYLMASTTEGFPTVVLEACHAGVPVVARNSGGTKEILNYGGGTLLKEDTPKECIELLENYLYTTNHPQPFEPKDAFAMSNMAKNYLGVYLSLADHSPTDRSEILRYFEKRSIELKQRYKINQWRERFAKIRGIGRLFRV